MPNHYLKLEILKLSKVWSQSWTLFTEMSNHPIMFKVHIFWEGHKILRNLHQLFDWQYLGQIISGDSAKFCGLLRNELYWDLTSDLVQPNFRCRPFVSKTVFEWFSVYENKVLSWNLSKLSQAAIRWLILFSKTEPNCFKNEWILLGIKDLLDLAPLWIWNVCSVIGKVEFSWSVGMAVQKCMHTYHSGWGVFLFLQSSEST